MRFANDKNKSRVFIDSTISSEKYYCPVCNEELIEKKGNKRIHHFAHKRGSSCHDTWHYDMSEWHVNWQNRFPIDCQEVVKEYNGEKHRADVLLESIKTVIEFQHSTINGKEFCKRNNFYKSLGYKVVWVFDVSGTIDDEKINFYRHNEFELLYNKSAFKEFTYYDDNVSLFFQIESLAEENETIIEFNELIDNSKKTGYYIDVEHTVGYEQSDYYYQHKDDAGIIISAIKAKSVQNVFYVDCDEQFTVDQFVSYISSTRVPRESVYNLQGSIFELWTLGRCNVATFYNSKTGFYVRVNSDPELSAQIYNGKCYGVFSKDKYKFTGQSMEIYYANEHIWKLEWKK